MNKLATDILATFEQCPEGEILTADELLHLGDRALITASLANLCKDGELFRIQRGLYVRQVITWRRSGAPMANPVVKALAKRTGEVIAPDGMRCAYILRLSTLAPARQLFLTTGRSRTLELGQARIFLEHSDCWSLALGDGEVGDVARALSYMGPGKLPSSLKRLNRTLPKAVWIAFCEGRARLPNWMALGLVQFLLGTPNEATEHTGAGSKT